MVALRARIGGRTEKITTKVLLSIIKGRRPSITRQLLNEYKAFLDTYGERGRTRREEPEEGEEGEESHYI